tara:strand:- start:339 stop:599 length:261 start_codon:yes stop_codon:yes gene_type:complete
MTERKIIITGENKIDDKFTHSTCVCNTCEGMKTMSKEWEEFSPKNNLQRRMKDVVNRIEIREASKMSIVEALEEEESSRPRKRVKR